MTITVDVASAIVSFRLRIRLSAALPFCAEPSDTPLGRIIPSRALC
jgi:hypothetical protein